MERKNMYFYYRPDYSKTEKLETLFELARRYEFNVVKDPMNANIIVSVGDDGTFLEAVRRTGFKQDNLYVGISTTGSLSIYCDFLLEDTSTMIEAMTTKQIEVRRYPLLEATVDKEGTFLCLNEFTIRSGIIKTFVIDVFIDNIHFETFRGDGMVVSTPTGSTAYSKSLNGAVVDPTLPCIQVSELASLNTNRYRTLGSSFLLGENRKLTLKVVQDGNDHPTMGLDNEAMSVKNVHSIDLRVSEQKIKTVKLKDNSFWHKVKRTFL